MAQHDSSSNRLRLPKREEVKIAIRGSKDENTYNRRASLSRR